MIWNATVLYDEEMPVGCGSTCSVFYVRMSPLVLTDTATQSMCDTGMFSGMRAKGPKADLALIVADAPAAAAGVFTTNVMAAAPVTFCRQALQNSPTAQAVGGHMCIRLS